MFKKIYKEVNDSIPVNEELLNSLLKKAEQPVKVIKLKSVYKYGTAIAAVLVLAASLIALPNLNKTKNSVKTSQDSIALTASDSEKKLTNEEPTNKALSYNEIQTESKEVQKSKSIDSDEIQEYSVDVAKESMKESELAVANDTLAVMRGLNEEMNIDEYLAILGFDLSDMVLPYGFKRLNETTPIYRDENEDIILCECVITYSYENKYLNLTVTPNKEYISEMLSKYPDNRVFGNDGYIGAYILKDNGGYSVDCYNFTPDEVDALVLSLK